MGVIHPEILLFENRKLRPTEIVEAAVVQKHFTWSPSSDHDSSPMETSADPLSEESLAHPGRRLHLIPARVKSRFRGCLLGGAVGDALAIPGESLNLVQIRKWFSRRRILVTTDDGATAGNLLGATLGIQAMCKGLKSLGLRVGEAGCP
jgi:hypothetical protein